MPIIFDLDGQSKEVNHSIFYLTGLVDRLFDDMLEILGGRVEVRDFRENWYQLVPFILFVVRLAHERANRGIDPQIQAYIFDQTNPDSYLNRFNNPEYKTLRQYDQPWLIDAVAAEYRSYWDLYNQGSKENADPLFAVNEHLGKMLGSEEKGNNLQDAFNFLNGKFLKGEIILYDE